jgi:hypothetical protein
MDTEIEKIYQIYSQIIEKIGISLPVITSSLYKSKFKYTSRALLAFIPKSGYISNAIISLCQSNDVYATSILFRSLIEHSFRHLYIYTRTLNENSDAIGEIYYRDLKADEDLKSIRKIIGYKKIVYPEDTQWNTKGEHNKKIGDVAKQFEIQSIFCYLVSHNVSKEEIISKGLKKYLLDRLIEYTNMSSGVHGGPFGELILENTKKDPKKFEAAKIRFATDALMLHKSLIETTYLFAYLMDSSLQKYYEEISGVK